MVDCTIALGGNFVDTLSVMRQTIARLEEVKEIETLFVSRLYQTSPVSDIPQPPYLNAVCRFQTSLSLGNLWKTLQRLEREMGKTEKPKNAPRLIDIDLIFYGNEVFKSDELIVPHPKWHERLFVLAPLADVADNKEEIQKMLKKFPNAFLEQVCLRCEKLR